MAQVREAEERVCTSVYFLSQTTRCERLAVELTERLLIHWSPPPSPVPAPPLAPRLPPPPPSPSLPEGLEVITLSTVLLSTMRMPQLRLGDAVLWMGFYRRCRIAHALLARPRRACRPPRRWVASAPLQSVASTANSCSTAYDNRLSPPWTHTSVCPRATICGACAYRCRATSSLRSCLWAPRRCSSLVLARRQSVVKRASPWLGYSIA